MALNIKRIWKQSILSLRSPQKDNNETSCREKIIGAQNVHTAAGWQTRECKTGRNAEVMELVYLHGQGTMALSVEYINDQNEMSRKRHRGNKNIDASMLMVWKQRSRWLLQQNSRAY